MMSIPHQIPNSSEPNHLAIIAFARGFLHTNPSLASYTGHLLLLDPGLRPVQQAEAYFMLYSTSSDISWLRAAVGLCESIPAIKNGLEGSEGFEEWKRILAELDKASGEIRTEDGQDVKMEENVDLDTKRECSGEETGVKIEESESVANELDENQPSSFTDVKDEDNRGVKVEHRLVKDEIV